VSKCQRGFSQPISLSLSRGSAIELGGTGALCIYAGLNGGRVAEEVPGMWAGDKASFGERSQWSAGGLPGIVGSDPRYSRRVHVAVEQRRHVIVPRQRSDVLQLIIPLLARNASGRLIAVGRRSMYILERDTHATRER